MANRLFHVSNLGALALTATFLVHLCLPNMDGSEMLGVEEIYHKEPNHNTGIDMY